VKFPVTDRTPFFIHIGFHKTATTWFQNQVFSEHPQIQYLGKAYPDHPSYRMSELKEKIISEPDTTFSPDDRKDELHHILDDHPLNGFRIHGMSYEGLSAGNNWFGGRTFYVADRLKKVFDDFDVKILMGIREQRTMVESMYSEYVKLGGSESLNRLLFSPFTQADDLLDKLKYAPIIEYYQKIFGEDSVKVYLFERFKNEKMAVLEELCNFLQIKPPQLNEETVRKKSNARLSSVGLNAMRIANHFFYGPMNNLSPVTIGSYLLSNLFRSFEYNTETLRESAERDHEVALRYEQDKRIQDQVRHHVNTIIKSVDKSIFRDEDSYRFELSEDVEDYLEDYYREANQNLQELVEPDLEAFDYTMPQKDPSRNKT
jgi:hypothetical protein